MGHRIEPYVSIPTKLQTDSTGYNPRVSNSHWLLFPITATIESVRISVITLSREPTIKICMLSSLSIRILSQFLAANCQLSTSFEHTCLFTQAELTEQLC